MEDGIHTAQIEWWLLDEDFVLDLKAHGEWRELQLDFMVHRWIDFYEDWRGYRHSSIGYEEESADKH